MKVLKLETQPWRQLWRQINPIRERHLINLINARCLLQCGFSELKEKKNPETIDKT